MQFSISHTKSFEPKKFAEIESKLTTYCERLKQLIKREDYSYLESSIYLSRDQKLLAEVQSLQTQTCSSKLKYIVVIGIGGSNLGTKAVYDALYGNLDNLNAARLPKVLFADTCNANDLVAITNYLLQAQAAEEVLLVLISKSGSTTETLVNFEVIYAALQKIFTAAAKQVVVITDFESPLWIKSQKLGFALLPIPKLVGGRFSVLSSVGLFPLLAAGIDIEEFRRGADAALSQCLQPDNNQAFSSAALLFYYAKEGKVIHDTFLFQPELESLGKWYRQLLGESIGKAKDKFGNTVHVGITPTVSIGSTDLHSVAQLYLGGPKDKFTTFVSSEKAELSIALPQPKQFPDLVTLKSTITTQEILQAILEGTKIAYQKADVPYMHCTLPNISSYSLGEFMQWKMLEIMYLAELFQINAFDQPNVEMYKVETKKLLQK